LFQNTGAHHGNATLNVTPEDFVHSKNFYPFDFTPHLCHSQHLHTRNTGHIDIELGYSTELTSNIYMIVYISDHQTLTIDSNRNVNIID